MIDKLLPLIRSYNRDPNSKALEGGGVLIRGLHWVYFSEAYIGGVLRVQVSVQESLGSFGRGQREDK